MVFTAFRLFGRGCVPLLGHTSKEQNAPAWILWPRVHVLVHAAQVLPELFAAEALRLFVSRILRVHVDPMHVLPPRVVTECSELTPRFVNQGCERRRRQHRRCRGCLLADHAPALCAFEKERHGDECGCCGKVWEEDLARGTGLPGQTCYGNLMLGDTEVFA